MGHVIIEKGLHTSPSKAEAILNCRRLEYVTQLYHKFIPNMCSLIGSLRRLLKSNVKFEWCDGCEKAFRDVKTCIASDQVLTHYDPAMPLKLACDASAYGLGVVLSHVLPSGDEKPIAFASRSLS